VEVSRLPGKRWIVVVLLVAGLAALLIATRSETSKEAEAGDSEPAQVEPIKGTELSRVKLSADAAKRLGIETAPVRRRGAHGKVIPYAAVLYDAEGRTFTYTSPEPLVFVRHAIDVDRVEGSRAFLSRGPPARTAVVTVGSQELFGTEYEVEED
jgi:hypothetical protein